MSGLLVEALAYGYVCGDWFPCAGAVDEPVEYSGLCPYEGTALGRYNHHEHEERKDGQSEAWHSRVQGSGRDISAINVAAFQVKTFVGVSRRCKTLRLLK